MEGQAWFNRLKESIEHSTLGEMPNYWKVWYRDYRTRLLIGSDDESLLRNVSVVAIDVQLNCRNTAGETCVKVNCGSLNQTAPIALRSFCLNGEDGGLRELLAFLGDSVLVGYHLGFDLATINRCLGRAGAGPLRNRSCDVAILAKHLRPERPRYLTSDDSLEELARNFGLARPSEPADDAYFIAFLWQHLTQRLADQLGRNPKLLDLPLQ